MPRISSRLVRQAAARAPQLVPLLRATRSIDQAAAEWRWIRKELPQNQWLDAIRRRAQLEPLQYILGTQPFGALDIACAPGVLIPRWETEEWVLALAETLQGAPNLSILDACTGSGCVPLLLKHELHDADVAAFDVSAAALRLAKENRTNCGLDVALSLGNVLEKSASAQWLRANVVTANPPYIPPEDWSKPVLLSGPERSVRMYEPRLALVGDLEFYTALVENVVKPVGAQAFVFELGYEAQAVHTAGLLPGWTCGRYNDSAGRLRCVVGWRDGPLLAPMVNGGYIST